MNHETMDIFCECFLKRARFFHKLRTHRCHFLFFFFLSVVKAIFSLSVKKMKEKVKSLSFLAATQLWIVFFFSPLASVTSFYFCSCVLRLQNVYFILSINIMHTIFNFDFIQTSIKKSLLLLLIYIQTHITV